jgi:S-adenosylmethionine:tRNA ribosyltransferase-isomerase
MFYAKTLEVGRLAANTTPVLPLSPLRPFDMLYTPIMRIEDFDYGLPAGQIAQHPPAQRDGARMLVMDRRRGQLTDRLFSEFPGLLRGDELLVFNNARVIPARLFGRRADPAGNAVETSLHQGPTALVEVFLSREVSPDVWEALVKPGKKLPVDAQIVFGEGELTGRIIARGEFGLRTIQFESHNAKPVREHFEALGHTPLPPYIAREDYQADRSRYQTVFAKRPGAVAAPTAGLHFTTKILDEIRSRGAEICELTLDVGLGTFQPVRAETLEAHTMHAESYEIPEDTAERIRAARTGGRPILAIGTTVVRALESAALLAEQSATQSSRGESLLIAGRGEATLFMYPGYSFRVVDALLTNFHLPRSTLLALVSAFAGRTNVLDAYRHAVQSGYRFYSYGDCMLLR